MTVDGKEYFWLASSEEDEDSGIGLVIATEVKGAARLFCGFDKRRDPLQTLLTGRGLKRNENSAAAIPYTIRQVIEKRFVVTPYTVRQVIEYALSVGWTPFEKGKDLCLGLLNDKIDLRLDQNTLIRRQECRSRLSPRAAGIEGKE